jgi:hypothetical protein
MTGAHDACHSNAINLGSSTGCTDYRLLNCQVAGSAAYCPHTPSSGFWSGAGMTVGICVEGAGVITFESTSVSFNYRSGNRPS